MAKEPVRYTAKNIRGALASLNCGPLFNLYPDEGTGAVNYVYVDRGKEQAALDRLVSAGFPAYRVPACSAFVIGVWKRPHETESGE